MLPAFSLFAEIGAAEAFSYFRYSRDVDLPATCLGSTRNDTCIFHPWLVPYICDMRVEADHQFDTYVPLAVFLDFRRDTTPSFKWSIPCSWAALAPPKGVIATCYDHKPLSHFSTWIMLLMPIKQRLALVAWSHAVELAVDKAISISHKLNPVVYPWPSLHPKFKGRCNAKKTFWTSTHSSVRDDPTGAFNPVSEVFSTKSRQIVRQVRRLKSFRRALKSFSETGGPVKIEAQRHQLSREWNVFLMAKGFGSKWASWILAFELVPFVPVSFPSCDIFGPLH